MNKRLWVGGKTKSVSCLGCAVMRAQCPVHNYSSLSCWQSHDKHSQPINNIPAKLRAHQLHVTSDAAVPLRSHVGNSSALKDQFVGFKCILCTAWISVNTSFKLKSVLQGCRSEQVDHVCVSRCVSLFHCWCVCILRPNARSNVMRSPFTSCVQRRVKCGELRFPATLLISTF